MLIVSSLQKKKKKALKNPNHTLLASGTHLWGKY